MAKKISFLTVNLTSFALITNGTNYLSSIKAKDFAEKVVKIYGQNLQNFDTIAINRIAKKYSLRNRSLNYYRTIENGLF